MKMLRLPALLTLTILLLSGCVNDNNSGFPTFTDQEVQAFLNSFAQGEGVQTTDSGLMYHVQSAGSGDQPNISSVVTFNLLGALQDGTIIAHTGNISAEHRVDELIPGLIEGMQLMRPGAIFRFVLPPDLGYEEPGQLAGYVLVYDVELVEVSDGGAPEVE